MRATYQVSELLYSWYCSHENIEFHPLIRKRNRHRRSTSVSRNWFVWTANWQLMWTVLRRKLLPSNHSSKLITGLLVQYLIVGEGQFWCGLPRSEGDRWRHIRDEGWSRNCFLASLFFVLCVCLLAFSMHLKVNGDNQVVQMHDRKSSRARSRNQRKPSPELRYHCADRHVYKGYSAIAPYSLPIGYPMIPPTCNDRMPCYLNTRMFV